MQVQITSALGTNYIAIVILIIFVLCGLLGLGYYFYTIAKWSGFIVVIGVFILLLFMMRAAILNEKKPTIMATLTTETIQFSTPELTVAWKDILDFTREYTHNRYRQNELEFVHFIHYQSKDTITTTQILLKGHDKFYYLQELFLRAKEQQFQQMEDVLMQAPTPYFILKNSPHQPK